MSGTNSPPGTSRIIAPLKTQPHSSHPRTPSLICRATPRILFSTKGSGSTAPNTDRQKNDAIEVVKVHNPYEYYFHIRRKQEYEQKQNELITPLMIEGFTQEAVNKMTYSVKQVGISPNNEGKFGIKSQRRFIASMANQYDMPKEQSQPPSTEERACYKFRSKRLQTSQKIRPSPQPFIKEPPQIIYIDDINRKNKKFHYNNIKFIKKLDEARRNSQPFKEDSPIMNFTSYSRKLQQLDEEVQTDDKMLKTTGTFAMNMSSLRTQRTMPHLINRFYQYYTNV